MEEKEVILKYLPRQRDFFWVVTTRYEVRGLEVLGKIDVLISAGTLWKGRKFWRPNWLKRKSINKVFLDSGAQQFCSKFKDYPYSIRKYVDLIKSLRPTYVASMDYPLDITVPYHNADKKSVLEISDEIRRLTKKALEGKLSLEELTGGTFTVTNLGPYGVEVFTPIINPPQTAILGIGKIAKRPAVVGDKIVVKSIAPLSLVFDHRVVDGVPAAKFLARVKNYLENPLLLLT